MHNMGVIASREGRYAEAITFYTKAIRSQPNYVLARCNLANVYLLQHRYAEAIEEYRRVLARDPTYKEAHYGLAMAMMKVGRVDEGRKELALSGRKGDGK
jgi:tetratricopeptide (TPR) repeat protein